MPIWIRIKSTEPGPDHYSQWEGNYQYSYIEVQAKDIQNHHAEGG